MRKVEKGIAMLNSVEDVLLCVEEWKDIWDILAKNAKRDIIIVGAGSTSEFILDSFRKRGIRPVVFCDNSNSKIGMSIKNLPIISVDEACSQYENALFYISTQLYYKPLYNQLKRNGIKEEQIIEHDLICQFQWEYNYKEYLAKNIISFNHILNSLSDEKSKRCFLSRLAFLVTRNRKYALEMRGEHQYFENFIDYKKLDLFVDVGSYIGDTVLELENYCDPARCKVIAFEMDDQLYDTAQYNLKHWKNNIEIIKKAVSNIDGISNVSGAMGVMQSIQDDTFIETQEENDIVTFPTCKLDTVLSEKYILDKKGIMIKMDIEGAEMSALQGAKGIIQKFHPILAICIYHREDDIIRIPEYLHSLYSGYKFYLRHYSDNQTETVLYAVE